VSEWKAPFEVGVRLCRRFRDANPEEIEALTLEGMRTAVMSQLHAGNLEVSVVGDLEPEQLEVCLQNDMKRAHGDHSVV